MKTVEEIVDLLEVNYRRVQSLSKDRTREVPSSYYEGYLDALDFAITATEDTKKEIDI